MEENIVTSKCCSIETEKNIEKCENNEKKKTVFKCRMIYPKRTSNIPSSLVRIK